jgi:branched-chain amino acid transport system substrate-binding protein
VAVEAALSGPDATTGQAVLAGARLAADDLDAAGGVLGRHLSVVGVDDGGTVVAARRVLRAVRAAHPVAVVGPVYPVVAAAVLPLLRPLGLPVVRLSTGGPVGGPGIGLGFSDVQLATVAAQEVVGVLGATKVAVVTGNGADEAAVGSALDTTLRKAGVAVTDVPAPRPGDDPGQAAAAVDAAVPQVTLYALDATSAEALATAAGAGGGHCLVVAPVAAPTISCPAAALAPLAQLPGGPHFAGEAHGPAASIWGALGHDAVSTVVAALRAAGRTTPSRVASALATTVGVAGVTGELTVDPATGDRRVTPLAVLDAHGGGPVVDLSWAGFAGWPPPGPK